MWNANTFGCPGVHGSCAKNAVERKEKQKMDYNKREAAEAKRMGAKLHKNSGRGMKKADGTWRSFIVDWKFARASFKLDKNVWSKVVTDTLKSDKEKNPALIIVLGEGNETVRLAIIEQEVLEQLDNNNNDVV